MVLARLYEAGVPVGTSTSAVVTQAQRAGVVTDRRATGTHGITSGASVDDDLATLGRIAVALAGDESYCHELRTWRDFIVSEQVLEGVPMGDIVTASGMSRSAVYAVRPAITKRARKAVRRRLS